MAQIEIIEIPAEMPKGWDIADAIRDNHWSWTEILQFIHERAKPVETQLLLPQLFDKKSGKPNLNHSTMARLMKSLYGHKLRFDAHTKKWHIWNGKFLERDEVGRIYDYAKETCQFVYNRALELAKEDSNPNELFSVAKYAITAQNASQIDDIIKMASKEKGIRVKHQDFDANSYIFNLQNGTYDLKADVFREHRITDNITKIVGYNYDKDSRCPFWKQTLRLVFRDDKRKIQFLQRFIGYCLTGAVDEQCFLFFYGQGKNGKSTITSALEMLFGEYFCKSPSDMLMFHKTERISNDIARLAGARLVVCDEVQDGLKLDEARVKNLTGGDSITARFLYQELFTFQPTHKIIMFGNHRPIIRGTDEGIWRRVILVPFNIEIPEERRLPMGQVKENLRNELPGIFNWALDGYRNYKIVGKLHIPPSVKEASNLYRTDSDSIGQFIRECCLQSIHLRIKCKLLYDEYKDWCRENNEYATSYRAFNERVKEKGFVNKAGTGNRHFWLGIDTKANVKTG